MLSVPPDNTVSNKWIIMKGKDMEGSSHGPIYTKEKNQRNISHMSQTKFKTGFSKIQVSITSLGNLLSDKMYANGNCLIICMQYQNVCTAPVWCQVSKIIMKEDCEKHGTVTYCNHVQHSYFNPQPSLTPCDNNKLSQYPS